VLYLQNIDYGMSKVQHWQVPDVLSAEFADPNPAVKAVEYDTRAKQINKL